MKNTNKSLLNIETMKRRQFLKATTAGMIISPFFLSSSLKAKSFSMTREGGDTYREPAKNIPVIDSYDVIIAGGGPAGIAAAIASGRQGVKTLLLESQGCLGGTWTAGLLSWILDYENKSGLMTEIISKLNAMGAKCPIETEDDYAFDVEKMKLLLEKMCLDAEVDILLHSQVAAAVINNDNRLTHIITESASGREAWRGKIFVDCTGDGDLAARAGCEFKVGDKQGNVQPMSLMGLISGVRFKEIEPFVRYVGDEGHRSKKRLYQKIVAGGYEPSTQATGLFPIRKSLFMLMANHEYGYKGFDTRDLTKATLHARNELHRIIEALRSHGGSWSSLHLVTTGDHIGVREGRRILGLYTVTEEDLLRGARFEDAVCHVTFGVDVHSVSKSEEDTNKSYSRGIKTKSYDIPLRALIAKDVKGLMMAGRCISGDFIAHSSYRVTGNAVPMGEVAGKASALAAKKNTLPQSIPIEKIKN